MDYNKIRTKDKKSSFKKGVLFVTYSALTQSTKNKRCDFKSRYEQILDWVGNDFDGCVSSLFFHSFILLTIFC